MIQHIKIEGPILKLHFGEHVVIIQAEELRRYLELVRDIRLVKDTISVQDFTKPPSNKLTRIS